MMADAGKRQGIANTRASANKTIFCIFCLFWCSFCKIQKASTVHGKVASITRRGGQSVLEQLHIVFIILSTKNYKRVFEFVEVIIQHIVSFFPPWLQ